MPKSQPANCSPVPVNSWIFVAAVNQASDATSSAAVAESPEGRTWSQTTRRPACSA
nr:hypothetical protein [Nocardioides marmotae]